MCAYVVAQLHPAACDPLDCSPLLSPWDSPGKNAGVGFHALLQGIFPTQGLNPSLLCLLYCRWILYLLSHRGNPYNSFTFPKS